MARLPRDFWLRRQELLDEIGEHGFASERGRAALRRVNRMHAMYDISQDDLRYVLATFVAVPIRWLDEHGWRPMTERERVASATYHRPHTSATTRAPPRWPGRRWS